MRDYTLETVDQWIALTPKEAQPKIKELRAVILSAVPGIEEGISWGQPYYRKDGLLAGFDAFKEYVSFGFGPSFESEFRAKLEAKGYKITTVSQGLGEINGFADIYLHHVQQTAKDHNITLR